MRPFAARRPLFYQIITQTTWTNRPAARLFRYQGGGRADADRFGPALPGRGGQALQRGVCAPFGLPRRFGPEKIRKEVRRLLPPDIT